MEKKFKKGDRVKAKGGIFSEFIKCKGTVLGYYKVQNNVVVGVEFDDVVFLGHNCKRDNFKGGKLGHCLWLYEKDLELVEKMETQEEYMEWLSKKFEEILEGTRNWKDLNKKD